LLNGLQDPQRCLPGRFRRVGGANVVANQNDLTVNGGDVWRLVVGREGVRHETSNGRLPLFNR
jgi:hypothetical protein